MNTLDFIIIIIILGAILYGFSKGFIKTLYSMLSLIIAFGVTYYLYPIMTKFVITQTTIHENLSLKIAESFNFSEIFMGLVGKEEQYQAINLLNVPNVLKMLLKENNNTEGFNRVGATSFDQYVSGMLANIVLNILIFIALFIIVIILMAVIINILDLIAKLPFLNMTNKLAGSILGVGLGSIIVILFIGIISLLITVTNNQELVRLVDESVIAGYIYENNPIIHYLDQASIFMLWAFKQFS
jgi:uncharacterized membrane protein required for colicin V production